jgi:predicted dehydrogenase
MTKSLNIGLVGSGFMGQAHTDAYRRAGMLYRNLPCMPVLYAIADQNDSLAEEARRKLGFAKAYGDWRRLIEDLMCMWSTSRHRTICTWMWL